MRAWRLPASRLTSREKWCAAATVLHRQLRRFVKLPEAFDPRVVVAEVS